MKTRMSDDIFSWGLLIIGGICAVGLAVALIVQVARQ